MGMAMAITVDLVDQTLKHCDMALNYVSQFKKRVDANDPQADAKIAYLEAVGVLFSQTIVLGHSDDFAKTLADLRKDQVLLAKRMSFFGGASETLSRDDVDKPSMI